MRSRGFTLIELLVVIAIIAILASILFPVFSKAREKARQTTCLSQVRQMATAMQMYAQDNNGRYPGLEWCAAMSDQGVSQKMFFCPSDAANDTEGPVSYGYSGLLVRADKTGVNEAQVKAPTEVGCIVDAAPAKTYPNGGLVYGGALSAAATFNVGPSNRHSRGCVIGYCDGHAKFAPVNVVNEMDMTNEVTRSFQMALALGLVDNPGASVEQIASGNITDSGTFEIGGDYCAYPIVMGAAEAYKRATGSTLNYYTRGFLGAKKTTGRSANAFWASGDPSANGSAIAIDCMVVIVSKNSKLTSSAGVGCTNATWSQGNTYAMNTASIAKCFSDGAGNADGYVANSVQCYTYDSFSGSRDFFERKYCGANRMGSKAVEVQNDLEMVDKVANDPIGIGYCSAAMADLNRVSIVQLGSTEGIFPSSNEKVRWVYPSQAPGNYPLKRSIKLEKVTGNTYAGAFYHYMFRATNGAIFSTPLFKASYWKP